MIVLIEDDSDDERTPLKRSPTSSLRRHHTDQHDPNSPPSYTPPPTYNAIMPLEEASLPIRSRGSSRSLHLFAVLSFVLFVFGFITWMILHSLPGHKTGRPPRGGKGGGGPDHDHHPFPYPPPGHSSQLGVWGHDFSVGHDEVHREHCFESATWLRTASASSGPHVYHSSFTSFEVPSPTLSLFARGTLARGHVKVISAPTDDETAKIYVVLRHRDEKVPEDVVVCLGRNQSGDIGMGIFTGTSRSRGHPLDDQLFHFDITIVLPRAHKKPDLRMDLPMFSYLMHGPLSFGNLWLRTTGKDIVVDAETAVLHTSNSAIRGSFSISQLLSMETSNALISADIVLHSEGNAHTFLDLRTNNAKVDASITLTTAGNSSQGGEFSVRAIAPGSSLNIIFPTSPPGSTLHFHAESTKPPSVSFHSAFEGNISVASSRFAPTYVTDEMTLVDAKDGSAKERMRILRVGRGLGA